MTRTEHLLRILGEECAEVAHRVSKALRFGLTEVQPGQPHTNAERIVHELCDMNAAIIMAMGDGVLPALTDEEEAARLNAKRDKVERFLAFSAGRGLVDGTAPDPTVPHPEAGGWDARPGGCPQCAVALTAGLDGAEMAYCPGCKFCTHPSQSAKDGFWHCNACDKDLGPLSPMVQG